MLVGGPAEAGEDYRRRLGPHGEKLLVLAGRTRELRIEADVRVVVRLEDFVRRARRGNARAHQRGVVVRHVRVVDRPFTPDELRAVGEIGPLGFQRVPRGQLSIPGPVDLNRLLAHEIEAGAVAALTGMLDHENRARAAA